MTGRALDPPLVDASAFDEQISRVFGASWLGLPEEAPLVGPAVRPFVWEPLGVPLVETWSADGVSRILSNVCTHRAAIVCEKAGRTAQLRCPYHGRQFALDGRALKAPGFGPDFPQEEDHLPELPTARLGQLRFVSLRPREPLPADAPWLRGLVLDGLEAEAPVSYDIPAHWALYCDNFLEGLHIPFVHPTLQASVARYQVETFPGGSVQIAWAKPNEPALSLAASHPLAEERIAALYFWFFPATMVNVYPWGLSLNVVVPVDHAHTKVIFQSFVGDASLRGSGAGAGLHEVELEDEAVVVSQQRGIRSPLYKPGRLADAEAAVAHFHALLDQALTPE